MITEHLSDCCVLYCQLFRGRAVKPRPPPATSGTCRRPSLLQLLTEPADTAAAGGSIRTVRWSSGTGDRCWRHLQLLRDRQAERRFDRLRCPRPPFEDRLLVMGEVFNS